MEGYDGCWKKNEIGVLLRDWVGEKDERNVSLLLSQTLLQHLTSWDSVINLGSKTVWVFRLFYIFRHISARMGTLPDDIVINIFITHIHLMPNKIKGRGQWTWFTENYQLDCRPHSTWKYAILDVFIFSWHKWNSKMVFVTWISFYEISHHLLSYTSSFLACLLHHRKKKKCWICSMKMSEMHKTPLSLLH